MNLHLHASWRTWLNQHGYQYEKQRVGQSQQEQLHFNTVRTGFLSDQPHNTLPAGFFSAFFFSFLGLPPSAGPFLLSLPAAAAAAAGAAAAAASGFLLSLAAALVSPPFLSPFFYNIYMLVSHFFSCSIQNHLQRQQEQQALGHHQGWFQQEGTLVSSCWLWRQCFGWDQTNVKCWEQRWPWCFSVSQWSALISFSFCTTPHHPTYTVREQETKNHNIDDSQVVVDKVGLVVQMVVDFFLSTVWCEYDFALIWWHERLFLLAYLNVGHDFLLTNASERLVSKGQPFLDLSNTQIVSLKCRNVSACCTYLSLLSLVGTE